MELDATVSGTSANSYLTVQEADDAMDAYFSVDRWEDLDQDKKAQLLMVGTRLIDSYSTWSDPAVAGQALAFPRSLDGPKGGPFTIRREVKRALLAFIDYFLEDQVVGLKRLQAEGVTSASILGQNASFDADVSELPGAARRELDQLKAMVPPLFKNRPYDGSGDSESLFG